MRSRWPRAAHIQLTCQGIDLVARDLRVDASCATATTPAAATDALVEVHDFVERPKTPLCM